MILELKMASPKLRRCLRSFLEVVRFVVTEYCAVGNHGDSIHAQSDRTVQKYGAYVSDQTETFQNFGNSFRNMVLLCLVKQKLFRMLTFF